MKVLKLLKYESNGEYFCDYCDGRINFAGWCVRCGRED